MPHHHCCVLGCRSDSRYSKRDESPSQTKETLRFFCVPSLTSKRALHNEWLKMIGRPELVVSRNTRVCSLHFIDGKPSKENPWPTLRLRNVNLPTRRRARSSKSTNGINDDRDLVEKSIHLKQIVKTETPKEFSCEKLFNCLKNGCKNGALNLKIVPSPLSPFQGLTKNHHQMKLAHDIKMETQNYYPLMSFSTQEPNIDTKAICQFESHLLDESESCSRDTMISPETIIHEYKQTQTDDDKILNTKISTQTQTDNCYSRRVPFNNWEKNDGKVAKMSKIPSARIYVNFGIDLVKSDSDMMRYYAGFRSYLEFSAFLDELRPKLVSENFSLDCFHTLENELLVALAHRKLGLDCQDLAYRSGMSLATVEKLVRNWDPVLEQQKHKPWIS